MEIKLNLIPPAKKNEIVQTNRVQLIFGWEINMTAVLFVFFLLLISLNYLLQINLDVQSGETEGGQNKVRYERISELDNSFKEINAQISLDESIRGDQLYWSNIFKKINDATPDGINVLKMANNNYKFLLAGTADTRDALVAMKDNLMQESCFTDINLPLSDLVSKENIDFQIEFNIKEECLRNK
jgi:Tfp pilus assembly protein PilN